MQHLVSSDHVPNTLIGTGDTSEGRHGLCLPEVNSLSGEIDFNHIIAQVNVKIAALVMNGRYMVL